MKTSIYIEDDLINQCRELSNLKTKKEIVHSALKEYILLLKRQKMLDLEGDVIWEGNLYY